MVIDTSAIVAALLNEAIAAAIEASSLRLLSAANLLEASMVVESRKGEAAGREFDLLLYRAGIPRGSITAIAPPMLLPRPANCRCCSGRRFRANRHRLRAADGNHLKIAHSRARWSLQS